jgi:GNAT superfamily N-acetyltransferase
VQWPDRFPESLIVSTVEDGDLFVASDETRIVATVTLQWLDPSFWGERDDAAFVHRLAVRRSHAGVGRSLLEWATQQAISHGRSYLCLDCLSTNRRLRRYYEDLGFKPVGEKSGPSDHPHSAAHGSWQAVLYEMAIPTKHTAQSAPHPFDSWRLGPRLDEIPTVAVEVFEDGDGAVGFGPRRFDESDPSSG